MEGNRTDVYVPYSSYLVRDSSKMRTSGWLRVTVGYFAWKNSKRFYSKENEENWSTNIFTSEV